MVLIKGDGLDPAILRFDEFNRCFIWVNSFAFNVANILLADKINREVTTPGSKILCCGRQLAINGRVLSQSSDWHEETHVIRLSFSLDSSHSRIARLPEIYITVIFTKKKFRPLLPPPPPKNYHLFGGLQPISDMKIHDFVTSGGSRHLLSKPVLLKIFYF